MRKSYGSYEEEIEFLLNDPDVKLLTDSIKEVTEPLKDAANNFKELTKKLNDEGVWRNKSHLRDVFYKTLIKEVDKIMLPFYGDREELVGCYAKPPQKSQKDEQKPDSEGDPIDLENCCEAPQHISSALANLFKDQAPIIP